MKTKGLHDEHRQRMRDRYHKEGLTNFAPHEILELLLFQSIPRVNTNPIGHKLINEFGSLEAVFRASEEELCRVEGVGKVSARMLCSVRYRLLATMLEGADFTDGNEALEMAAGYHMYPISDGMICVLSREMVLDYESDDGDWTGICEDMDRAIRENGITEYAIVVRCDNAVFPSVLVKEFEKGLFPWVWILTRDILTKVTDFAGWEAALKEADIRPWRVELRKDAFDDLVNPTD